MAMVRAEVRDTVLDSERLNALITERHLEIGFIVAKVQQMSGEETWTEQKIFEWVRDNYKIYWGYDGYIPESAVTNSDFKITYGKRNIAKQLLSEMKW